MAAVGAVAAVVVLLFVVDTTLRQPLRESRAAYDSRIAIGLPGASWVRLAEPEVQLYRGITAAIDRNCESFLELPGMGNFYIWSEEEPPTGYVATAWPTLFDDAHQRKVIEQTRSIEGLCLLRNIGLAQGWSAGTVPPGPLVRYLHRGFEPVVRFGSYELLKREGLGSAY
jgi:hypothetical protein